LTVGRFTDGGDLSLAAGAPGAALTLAAADTSDVTNFGVTGTTGSATLTTNAGHTLTVSNLSIPAGTTLTKAGAGILNVNGTGGAGTGTLAVTGGQVGGTGIIPGVLAVNSGGAVSPGTSVGKLSVTGATTFAGGGRYLWEYASVDQTAVNNTANFGVTHDHLNGIGALNITATSGSPFTIVVGALTFSPAPTPINYTIGTFAGGITGFAANAFNFQGAFSGTPTIAVQGNNLVLTITPIPEPVHLLLLCAGGAGLARWVRRRRAAAA
jgi:hypothetical protein